MKKLTELTMHQGAMILLRTDLDVPVVEGKVQELYRIHQQRETIEHLLTAGAKVLMIAHCSAVDTLEVLIPTLTELLGSGIHFVPTPNDIADFRTGEHQLGLLQDVRHWKEEIHNDISFAKQLSQGFTAYVNNGFAVSHREHASVVAITELLPSYAGLLLEKEVEQLVQAVNLPPDGKVIVIGGAKAETKIPVIRALLPRAETILVGGVVANDVLKAQGKDTQQSVTDENATELLEGIDLLNPKLLVPSDFVVQDGKYLDIGEKTIHEFVLRLSQARTIIWNGPMGMFEDARFQKGTKAVARAIADSRGLTIIGGGDTIAAVDQFGFMDKYQFVSTGGGAMLAFLAGQKLPGLKALGYYS